MGFLFVGETGGLRLTLTHFSTSLLVGVAHIWDTVKDHHDAPNKGGG